jgi:hypothetical protein
MALVVFRPYLPGGGGNLCNRHGPGGGQASALIQGYLRRYAAAAGYHLWPFRRVYRRYVWTDTERANTAVSREASALRAVVILAASFPGEPESRMRALIRRYIEEVATQQ